RRRRAGSVTPAHERARLAGVLVEDDEVEEQLALHVLLADGVIGDALFFRPSDNVLVEQALGVFGRAVLAVVVDQEGKLLARRRSGRGGANGGSRKHGARCLENHEPLPRWSSLPQCAPSTHPIAATDGICLVHRRYAQALS